MADKRDYYEVLGVDKNATDADIKAAYKQMAIKYHPDRNPDDKEAEAKFKEAAEAYDVLHDPQKRQQYDQFGFQGLGGAGGFGGGAGMNMDDIFSMFGDIFGGHFDRGGFGGFGHFGGGARRTVKGSDLRIPVRLTLEECATGVDKKFKVRKKTTCKCCGGSGAEAGSGSETCSQCHGSGHITQMQRTILGPMQMQTVCPTCHGEGKIIKNKCHACAGTGTETGEEVIEVHIPAGVQDNVVLTVAGKGNAAPRGGIPGDVQVFVEVEPHKEFLRQDKDVIYNLLIDVATATLGGNVEVPTLGGKVRVKIEPGTQPGKIMRLRGKGIPAVPGYGYGVGDLIIHVSVYIPETLSSDEKKAMETMQKSDHFQPSASAKKESFNQFKKRFE